MRVTCGLNGWATGGWWASRARLPGLRRARRGEIETNGAAEEILPVEERGLEEKETDKGGAGGDEWVDGRKEGWMDGWMNALEDAV